jgi:hypothetical protein
MRSAATEECDVTQAAALEDASENAFEFLRTCASFEIALRAAEKAGPINLVSIQ